MAVAFRILTTTSKPRLMILEEKYHKVGTNKASRDKRTIKKVALLLSELVLDKLTLKVLTVFCETIFGFLEPSANRDSKWFSDL